MPEDLRILRLNRPQGTKVQNQTTQSKNDPALEVLRDHINISLNKVASAESAHELRTLTLELLRDLLQNLKDITPNSHLNIRDVKDFIAGNLHEGLTLQTIANSLGYSTKYCSHWFQVQTGKTFSHYHTQVRLNRAKTLLADPGITIATIAQTVGFQDQFSFSRFFKRHTAASPSSYRNNISIQGK